ncbi:hypothetical protein [Tsukamurella paurometabola]|uniref:Uncharacterized protein n=1 Tax=Tsukamurella paurometabola TaxID=2061 RepID=A0A3P8L3R5_TSUPA|nr:hypothetical protein [Tsukamurella paurometabola]UEA84426.1 hypothetical protein LK411_06280 [Tsukamurella paurometabola]VDR36991.1 Uncharacterised protein [Tsukamurella paurometabola]
MSAVEDRLAATLAKHQFSYFNEVDCRCGWVADLGDCSLAQAHAAHVAAVIASSDDLAVIELPKPNEREDDDTATTWGEAYNNLQVGVHDEYADQVQVWVDYEPIEPWSPREAVEFASHLLAAAKAAEGVTSDGE